MEVNRRDGELPLNLQTKKSGPSPNLENSSTSYSKQEESSSPKIFVVREESFFKERAPLPLGKSPLLSLEKSEESSLLAREDRDAPSLDNV